MPPSVRTPAAGAGAGAGVKSDFDPSDRPTHPKRQTFVLLAGVFVVVLLLAVISTLAA